MTKRDLPGPDGRGFVARRLEVIRRAHNRGMRAAAEEERKNPTPPGVKFSRRGFVRGLATATLGAGVAVAAGREGRSVEEILIAERRARFNEFASFVREYTTLETFINGGFSRITDADLAARFKSQDPDGATFKRRAYMFSLPLTDDPNTYSDNPAIVLTHTTHDFGTPIESHRMKIVAHFVPVTDEQDSIPPNMYDRVKLHNYDSAEPPRILPLYSAEQHALMSMLIRDGDLADPTKSVVSHGRSKDRSWRSPNEVSYIERYVPENRAGAEVDVTGYFEYITDIAPPEQVLANISMAA